MKTKFLKLVFLLALFSCAHTPEKTAEQIQAASASVYHPTLAEIRR